MTDQRTLLGRRWARRVAGAVVVLAAANAAATSILVSDDAASRPEIHGIATTWEQDVPRQAAQVIAASPPRASSAAAISTTTTPTERVRALRELERRDPAAAMAHAATLVDDPVGLVRVNAIAVLARSDSPEATVALGRLDPESRELGLALQARR